MSASSVENRAARDGTLAGPVSRRRRRGCLAAALRQLLESHAIDGVAGHDGHARRRRRSQRRLPRAAFQKRPFADERAGADLGHLLAVDLDREDTVEQEVQLVPRRALLDERLSGLEPLPLRRCAALHDLAREAPLELALRGGHDGRSVFLAPGRPLAVRLAIPGLEVDRARLLHEDTVVAVDPVPRKAARADELVLGRAVGSNGEREGRPGRSAVDAEERLAADPARNREARTSADRLDEPYGVVCDLQLGSQRVVRDAGEDHVLRAEPERRRPDERLPGLAVADDATVVDLDPGLQEVRLAETILVLEPRQVAGGEPVGRRLVVVADPELERHLRHPFDRLRRDPRDRGDGFLDAHGRRLTPYARISTTSPSATTWSRPTRCPSKRADGPHTRAPRQLSARSWWMVRATSTTVAGGWSATG